MVRVGDRLKQERLRKKLTVDEVAKATRIRPSYITAIENGDYKALPSSAYIQGFVRNYATYLGLPVKETVAIFKREFDEREFLGVLPESFTKPQKPLLSGFRLGPLAIALTIAGVFIVGFIVFQYRAAFLSPSLIVNTPKENATITSQVVSVTGKTDSNTAVTINDTPVYIDKDGNFKKDVSVFQGNTIITIKAVNSFGKQSSLTRHIVVE